MTNRNPRTGKTVNNRESAVVGCILGTAVGDALGLPSEGLSKRRQRRLFGQANGHRLILRKGMVSDDTEHTCMVAQSLIESGDEVKAFTKNLAWRLRLWLLGLPGGVGFGTLRAILKLWMGFPGHRSGVFSAGNGAAMRSAILGVCFGDDSEKLRTFVKASTRITHTDPKAEYGALAVAIAAGMACRDQQRRVDGHEYYSAVKDVLREEDAAELFRLIEQCAESVQTGHTTEEFAAELGLQKGVTGYIYHTVPVVLHAWLSHQDDFRSAVLDVVRCGGDTDTTAAIVGGIVGVRVGKAGIPASWLAGVWEWPRTVRWLEELGSRLADALADGRPRKAPSLRVYKIFLRNLLFIAVILIHGLRRLLPPY